MTKAKKENTKNRENNDPSTLTGRNIYKDSKGRVIYYRERIMTGYVIKAENVIKYRQYSSRILYGILAGVLIATFFKEMDIPMWFGVFIGIAFWAVLSIRFFKVFLPSLIQIKNFVPTEKATMIESLARAPRTQLILKTVLLCTFAILLVVNLKLLNTVDIYSILATAVGACAALIYAGILLIALLKQRKENN